MALLILHLLRPFDVCRTLENFALQFERETQAEAQTIVADPAKKILTILYTDFRLSFDTESGEPQQFFFKQPDGSFKLRNELAAWRKEYPEMNAYRLRQMFLVRCLTIIREVARPWIKDYPIEQVARFINKTKENNNSNVPSDELRRIFDFDFDTHAFWNQKELTGYWVYNSYDSDQWVGLTLYFLNDEFVFSGNQTGRKSDETIEFVSKEAAIKVREFLRQFVEENDDFPIMTAGTTIESHYTEHFENSILAPAGLLDGNVSVKIHRRPWAESSIASTTVKIQRFDSDETELVESHRLTYPIHANHRLINSKGRVKTINGKTPEEFNRGI